MLTGDVILRIKRLRCILDDVHFWNKNSVSNMKSYSNINKVKIFIMMFCMYIKMHVNA